MTIGTPSMLVAMSLYGDVEMYMRGALLNCREIKKVYPGAELRIYLELGHAAWAAQLEDAGARISTFTNRGGIYGMFPRFLAAEEPYDYILVPGAPTDVVNVREAAAVAQWQERLGVSPHV